MEVLIVAYKIEANLGSEDESGYNIVKGIIASGVNVTLISRRNNLEKLRTDEAFGRATLVGVDVPRLLSPYKKGSRGVLLYYYLWQICVGLKVWQLQRKRKYDVLHLLNFHADWAPHFLSPKRARVVWGPIAHAQAIPADFLPKGDRWGPLANRLKQLSRKFQWRFDPFLRRAIRGTDVILYANDDFASPFRKYQEKIVLRPYAGSFMDGENTTGYRSNSTFTVLSVGRLVPFKGFIPTMEAFARFCDSYEGPDDAELVIVGSGPLEGVLKERARSMEVRVGSCVRFVPWIDREGLRAIYKRGAIFVYPSVEAQGLVVSEALSVGVGVIALEGTGPAFLAGPAAHRIVRGSGSRLVEEVADGIGAAYDRYTNDRNGLKELRVASIQRYRDYLCWGRVVSDILDCYS